MGGEKSTGANGLGENQGITGLQTSLAHDLIRVDQAIHRKPQGQFLALAGVSAYQRAACLVENFHGTGHHLVDHILNLGFNAVGNCGDGRSTLRLGTHGKYVTQAVVGRDLAEGIRVIDERSKEIHCVNHSLTGRDGQHSCIIRGVESNEDIIPLQGLELSQCS